MSLRLTVKPAKYELESVINIYDKTGKRVIRITNVEDHSAFLSFDAANDYTILRASIYDKDQLDPSFFHLTRPRN